jgi:hypothetical protein
MVQDLFNGNRKISTRKFMKVSKISTVSYLYIKLKLFCLANFSNARKLFRMLKFLIEYKNIRALLGKAENMKLHKFILALIPRVAFFFYWFLDTIIVMIKIKVLKNWDAKNITHKWALLWTIANFTGILGALVELYELATEEVKLIASKNVS